MKRFLFFPAPPLEFNVIPEQIYYVCFNQPLLITVATSSSSIGFEWTQVSGPSITIENPNSITPTIVFPNNFVAGNQPIVLRITSSFDSSKFKDLTLNTSLFSTLPLSISRVSENYVADDLLPLDIKAGVLGPLGIENSYYLSNLTPEAILSWDYSSFNISKVYKAELYINTTGNYTLVDQVLASETSAISTIQGYNHLLAIYYKDELGNVEVKRTKPFYFKSNSNFGVVEEFISNSISYGSSNTKSNISYSFNSPIINQQVTSYLVNHFSYGSSNSINNVSYSFNAPLIYQEGTSYLLTNTSYGSTNTITNQPYQFNAGGYQIG
ncbi:hypothetical protein H6G33_09355 [Calothrix sp. FACHB-1219]|uniref:hypothetical protein n=1 Tax=unclassified Calothrix TaxID=2619626 RepID=UPI001685E8AE|nr:MULTISPECIES: hypothetical protein [unclassified Calothrix]MBD2201552.1 hypothetical protein [Calothrix sp. FACHB-168]MBD2217238.1 hypothetical protein [Calothrix sp. FACHB-1219]